MNDELVFEPETVTIPPGDTVRWRNVGEIEHTITAYENEVPKQEEYFAIGGFESEEAAQKHLHDGLVAPGERFEHTFDVSSLYEYYCIPHESAGMLGKVRVNKKTSSGDGISQRLSF